MVKQYTKIWNSFQFRAPCYIDGHFEPHQFDLIKWVDCEPHEIRDWFTGEKKISTRYCFTVGTLIWDPKEQCFSFESCGLRYLEHRIDGLEEWIIKFSERMKKKLQTE